MAEHTRNKPRRGQPINRHPLFPVTVALWIGALFGIASLAIPPALLEAVVRITHIDAIVAAAAPPLGATARILLALALAAAGAIGGLAIMRRRAGAAASSRAGAAATAPAEPAAIAAASSPDGDAEWLEWKRQGGDTDGEIARPADEADYRPWPAEDEPEPQILAVADVAMDVDWSAPEPDAAPDAPPEVPADAIEEPPVAAMQGRRAPRLPIPVPTGSAAERIAGAELSELSHLELLERLALAMQRHGQALPPASESQAGESQPAPFRPLPLDEPLGEPPGDEAIAVAVPQQRLGARDETAEPAASGGEATLAFPPRLPRLRAQSDGQPAAASGADAAPASDSTEKALRDALTALQRMSGAA